MKVKILFITDGSLTGSEQTLFTLIEYLPKDQFEAILLTRYDDFFAQYPFASRWCYTIEKILKSRMLFRRIVDYLKYPKNQYYPFQRPFKKIIDQHKPSVIYYNSITLPAYFDYFLRIGIPIVFHGHSLRNYLSAFPRPLIINRIKSATLIISVSQVQNEALRDFASNPNMKILNPPIILANYQPIPEKYFATREGLNIPKDTFIWTMASVYFNENKNPVRFVEVAQRIIQNSPRQVFFQWIGGDVDDPWCKEALTFARDAGILKYIIFHGNVSRQRYLELLNATDGFIMVSKEESFSIVSLEAIAMGKPLLAFDCGGIHEFCSTENSVIVPEFATENMAVEAIRVMKDPDQFNFERMHAALHKFDAANIGNRWMGLLQELI